MFCSESLHESFDLINIRRFLGKYYYKRADPNKVNNLRYTVLYDMKIFIINSNYQNEYVIINIPCKI